jgi:hypothetical protein
MYTLMANQVAKPLMCKFQVQVQSKEILRYKDDIYEIIYVYTLFFNCNNGLVAYILFSINMKYPLLI